LAKGFKGEVSLPHVCSKLDSIDEFQTTFSIQSLEQSLKLVLLIINWLVWKPESDHLIDLGMDKILGIGEASILSVSLLNTLNQNGVLVLAQARSPQDHKYFMTTWLSNKDLALVGNLVEE
jgi:hypothetical protein